MNHTHSTTQHIFALIDCNNFYASCERIFQPHLINKPIVVLSNNDGCIIARSNEAKALGIEMGAPFFKFRHLIAKHQVTVFSSNYSFYGDISNRVMKSLQMLVPDLEIYSIDEAFLRLDNISYTDPINLCQDINRKIHKWLGIPTSIGIAPTKTLAKIANHVAKKNLYNLTNHHVCDLRNHDLQNLVLSKTKIEDIWGIGKGIASRLKAINIYNALELREAPAKHIRNILGVVGERIVLELRGISCLNLEEIQERKNILSSKSFGKNIYDKAQLKEAVANYTIRACEKLRHQSSLANNLYVYIRTSPFIPKHQQHYAGEIVSFNNPTDNVSTILKNALAIIDKIYVAGFAYKKAGVALLNILPGRDNLQTNLFTEDNIARNQKSEIIYQTLEKINRDFGKNKHGHNHIFYAIQGTQRTWAMQCGKRSPLYTTNINELATV